MNIYFTVVMNMIRCSQSPELGGKCIDYVLTNWTGLRNLPTEKRKLFYAGFLTMAHVNIVE